MRGQCETFGLCRNHTEHVIRHAVLGPVPCCFRCAKRTGEPLYAATEATAEVYSDYWTYRADEDAAGRIPLRFDAWAADPVECDQELLAAAFPA